MDWKIRAPAGTSMMQKQFGGAMFVRSLACCWNDPAWKVTAKNALASEATNEWAEGLYGDVEAQQGSGIQYVK